MCSSNSQRKLSDSNPFPDTATINTCFSNAYKRTNNDIKHQIFNTLLSGSTLSTIIVNLDYIYAANVGDSKVVVYVMPKNKGGSSKSSTLCSGMRNTPRLGKRQLIQEDSKLEEVENFLSVPGSKSSHKNPPGTPKFDQSYQSYKPGPISYSEILVECQTSIKIKELSVDHKPNLDLEKERILKMNGEIRQIYNKHTNRGIGVERVWLKKHDFPGLAMSRSLGDKLAHTVGVIPEPDLKTVHLDRDMNDYLVLLASDGVWD